MPARLPTKFCAPVHRPAANGPAQVCVIAQRFDEKMPYPNADAQSNASDVVASCTMTAPSITVEARRPITQNDFRILFGLAPFAIIRSDNQPDPVVEIATANNGSAPKMDISA